MALPGVLDCKRMQIELPSHGFKFCVGWAEKPTQTKSFTSSVVPGMSPSSRGELARIPFDIHAIDDRCHVDLLRNCDEPQQGSGMLY